MCSLLRPPAFSRFISVRLKSAAASQSLPAKRDLCDPSSPDFLTFEDPRAFKVKSLWELIRALGVFRLCSFPALVNNCGKVRQPLDLCVKHTYLFIKSFDTLGKCRNFIWSRRNI